LETLNRLNNERNRIARDLHDNLGAELTIVTSKLYTKIFKTEKQTEREELEHISKQTRNASIVLRETVWSIKSEKLTVTSLRNKIEEFYNRLEDPNIFSLNFQISNEDFELGPLLALNLFRIAQEALTNILKYADAKHVHIEISNKVLKISDDGKGFDIEKVKKGYGLNNMESRAKEMNASYSISSSENGTEIKILL
jgi:signal transduction histidine kinase